MAQKHALPNIDIETHVPAAITAVRRSHGWPGLFLQERRGFDGEVRYMGGPRQHVLYCFLKDTHSDIMLDGDSRRIHYRQGESRFTPAGHSVAFRWSGEVQVLVLGIEPWFFQGICAELGAAPSFAPELNFHKLPATHPASVLLRQLGEELNANPGMGVMAESLGRAIVVQILREFGHVRAPKIPSAAPPIAVLRAVELMRQRLAGALRLGENEQVSSGRPFVL